MIFFVLYLLLNFSFAQEVLTLDYRKVYELALKNNRDIQRLLEQIRSLNIDYELARKFYLPTVYVGGSLLYDLYDRKARTDFNLSVVSTIYEFQKTKARIEVAKIKRDIANLMLEQLYRDIQLKILQLFTEAHLYKKLAEVKREEMAIAYVRFDRAREKKALGLSTDHEVLRLESVYREKRAELFYAQHMYNQVLLQIKQLAGIPYETFVELKDLPFEEPEKLLEDFSKLKAEALKGNTSIRLKNLEIASYEEEIKSAKQTIAPKVNLKISTDKSGLEVYTPIYDWGRPYKVEYLVALKGMVQKEKEALEQSIGLIFFSAPYEWEYLKAKWTEAITKDRFAEENLMLKRSEYELELAFDLGYAMAEKSEAERQVMEAKYKLLLFWARLFNLAGRDPFRVLEYN